jgi:hypothetical protein
MPPSMSQLPAPSKLELEILAVLWDQPSATGRAVYEALGATGGLRRPLAYTPVTAIREGDTDGNDATAGDPSWNSLQNTPNVSDYPSTQSTFSGAAAALAGVLGTDQVAFSVTSGRPFADITRSFTSVSQAARESADSRIYAGIHFRSACEDGLVLGRKIGERAAALYLQRVKK